MEFISKSYSFFLNENQFQNCLQNWLTNAEVSVSDFEAFDSKFDVMAHKKLSMIFFKGDVYTK